MGSRLTLRPRVTVRPSGNCPAKIRAMVNTLGGSHIEAGKALPLGLVDGNGGQVLNQIVGCAIAWELAIVGT